MSGDHNMAQEPTGIEKLARDATVKYTIGDRTYEKISHALNAPKDAEHLLGVEGEVLMLIIEAYKHAWKEGFTAKLSGVQEDE